MSKHDIAQVDPFKPEPNLEPNTEEQSKDRGDNLLLHDVLL